MQHKTMCLARLMLTVPTAEAAACGDRQHIKSPAAVIVPPVLEVCHFLSQASPRQRTDYKQPGSGSPSVVLSHTAPAGCILALCC